jgi:hypothetical protein
MSTANASIIVKLDINTIQNMIHARCITLTIILVVLAVLANLASTVTAAITPVALVALAVLANTVTAAITPADLAAASPVVNTLESRDNIEQTRRLPFMDTFRTKPFKWWRQDARQGMQARVNDGVGDAYTCIVYYSFWRIQQYFIHGKAIFKTSIF